MSINLTPEQRKEIHEKFKKADTDNSGYLDKEEIKAALKDITGSDTISDQVAEDLMKNIDSNNDGQINFEEFEKYLASKSK
jgi:Ca2+-binding EF-hand superfamily protein